MRALAKLAGIVSLLIVLVAPVVALAQTTYSFDLPRQPLADSLRDVGTRAHVNVIFDPAAVGHRTAPALKGSLEVKQALAMLLGGTGFIAEFTGADTVVIKPAPAPAAPASSPAGRSQTQRSATQPEPTTLDKVTVLGSLIPRSKIETASPLIVITAEDIKNRGFSSVADALQNATVSTGSVNNTAVNTGDIWAVKTISLFGLDPSYTKFLIDGRPMPLFSSPAQTGTVDQLYTNLGGIPINLVDRIEILPGGQSSLYGSDAVAGVVNIVLKKNVRLGTLDARYGWYSDGGGRERTLSFTDNFNVGKLNLMTGVQVGDRQPMWAFQRAITAQNFAGGLNPQQDSQNVYAQGLFYGRTYFPAQPSDCDALTGLFGGSEHYGSSPFGAYCGSTTSVGYNTLMNKSQSAGLTVHATWDVNDRVQLYADLLDTYQKQSHRVHYLFSAYIFDPVMMDQVMIGKDFAPEEIGNSLDDLLSQTNYENTYQASLGGKVDIGRGWNLDVGFTRSYEQSDDRQSGLLATNVPGSYGSMVLGPYLGGAGSTSMYAPDYALLANRVTPAQFASLVGAASVHSGNRNDQLRAQLTQTSLFTLPGGDAGLAVVAEGGYESWVYAPSPLLVSGYLLNTSWNPSFGHRDRYAAAAELNLPLFKMFTADLSTRYDSYDAEGAHFSKPTYSLGLEFRPFDTLLLRGKYSTSFKAPSLIDQFEGGSSGTAYITDWVNCGLLGYTGSNAGQCPMQYRFMPTTRTEVSNPDLQPLTAKNFSYGLVWSPTPRISMSADYQHIAIRNEVLKESTLYVMQTQWYCMDGTLDPQSPTCQAINAQVIRGPAAPGSNLLGPVTEVITSKVNIARETNDALNASFTWRTNPYAWGWLDFDVGYTRVLTHRQQQFPGDPVMDFLRNPGFSTEFQTKVNAALTWGLGKWSATLYGSYFGPTPNFYAQIYNSYDVPYAAKLPAWRIYNAAVNYSPTPAWQLSLRVNNFKNSMPPLDVTALGTYPFNAGNYNPYGREIFVEARYQFGHGGEH